MFPYSQQLVALDKDSVTMLYSLHVNTVLYYMGYMLLNHICEISAACKIHKEPFQPKRAIAKKKKKNW